jgi:hypothetical protein
LVQLKTLRGFDMDLALLGMGLSVLGSIITSAIMVGSMKADIHHVKQSLTNLADQQNQHLQYHLQKKE